MKYYQEFRDVMISLAEYVEAICKFRDSAQADEIKTDSEEQDYLKTEMLLLTEMFELDDFAKAIRYYNKPDTVKGYIKIVDNIPVLHTGTEQIKLNKFDYVERAVNAENQNCYTEDEIYFYQLDKVKDLEDIDGMYIQIRR